MQNKNDHNIIIERICQNNFKVFIVGGAIRDLLMGIEPHDYDIATSANFEELEKIFDSNIFKIDYVGKAFGVTMINGIEVAQFRKDLYNCNEKFELIDNIENDLSRRDLTINAIAFCPSSGDIIDPFNGLNDLKNKLIRFVGDPIDRIMEDPLRIIRACRFAAKINGEIETNSLNAMIECSDLIKNIPKDRIQKEIIKAMDYTNASIFFNYLHIIGVLKDIFPKLDNCIGHEHGDKHIEDIYTHSMIVGDSISPKYPIVKLAGYLHDIGKPDSFDPINKTFYKHADIGADILKENLKELRFSNEDIDKIIKLVKFHMRDIQLDSQDKTIRKLISEFTNLGIDFKDYLRLRFADQTGNLKKINDIKLKIQLGKKINKIANSSESLTIKDLKITGQDIMKILNIKPGPIIGNTLKILLDKVIENPDLNNFEDLKRIVIEIN